MPEWGLFCAVSLPDFLIFDDRNTRIKLGESDTLLLPDRAHQSWAGNMDAAAKAFVNAIGLGQPTNTIITFI